MALAYDKTDLALNLPIAEGTSVDVTVYDINSVPVRQDRGISYQAPLRVSLDKYSLLVVEPAR